MAENEEIKPEKEKDDSRLFIGIGAVFTFLWIGFFIVLYSQAELPKEWNLNHLGDFLAGVFAPLAVFWFVLGFFLQIKEIRYQRIEINRLGGFTERQAHAVEKQVAIDELAQRPKLVFEHTLNVITGNTSRFEINFSNKGGPALNAQLTSPLGDIINLKIRPKKNIYREAKEHYIIEFTCIKGKDFPQDITLEYRDNNGWLYRHKGLLGKIDQDSIYFFNNQEIIDPKPPSLV